MKPIDCEKIKTLLITRTDRIGDLVLSTPVFEALRKKFPNARIYALVLPATRDIVAGNPFIDEVLIYDKRGKHKSMLSSFFFAQSLRRLNIDCAIHLHPTNRVHLLSWTAGIPIRIGYDAKTSYLLTHRIPSRKHEGGRHESEYNFDLLKLLDIPQPEIIQPLFTVDDVSEKQLAGILEKHGLGQGEYIVLSPSASCRSKIWPAASFATLADRLWKKTGKHIVLVGSEGDRDIISRVADAMQSPMINLAGALSLKLLAALFKKATLLISNDSGPAHVAAALDIPVVSLFGRNDSGLAPSRWRPLGKKSRYLHKQVGCVRCLAHDCEKEYACLRSITPDEVYALIEKDFPFVVT